MMKTDPRQFEIWWVPFAFPDKPGKAKNRPSVIPQWDGGTRIALVTRSPATPGATNRAMWCCVTGRTRD